MAAVTQTFAARLPLLLALATAATGCATLKPRAHAENFKFEPYGELSATREQSEAFKKAMASTFATLEPGAATSMSKSVKILQKAMPEGVTVKEGVISTTRESGLEVVGSFHFTPAGATSAWFGDYTSTGRKILCYPQVPLTWVTLLMWQVFIPLSYPCVARSELPIDEGYGYLRVAADQLRASTVVIVTSSVDDSSFFSAEGFMLKSRDDAPSVTEHPEHPNSI